MKRGQGVLHLELFHNVTSKLYDALRLWVLWHLHEAQGSFNHRGYWGGEHWVCNIVELLVKVAWANASALGNSGPVFSPALISCSVGYSSSFIFVLWGVLGQIII